MVATGGVGENNLQLVHVRGCGKLWRYCCWKVKVKNPKTLYENKVTSGMQVEALFVSEIFHFPLELGLRSSLTLELVKCRVFEKGNGNSVWLMKINERIFLFHFLSIV